MKIIIDLNILFSAIMKDSLTRELILESDFEFFFPHPALFLIEKHKHTLLQKSGLSPSELSTIISVLFRRITLLNKADFSEIWEESKKIMDHIDSEDTLFLAAALFIQSSVIWTEDKHFQKQDKVKILTTKEVLDIHNSHQ